MVVKGKGGEGGPVVARRNVARKTKGGRQKNNEVGGEQHAYHTTPSESATAAVQQ